MGYKFIDSNLKVITWLICGPSSRLKRFICGWNICIFEEYFVVECFETYLIVSYPKGLKLLKEIRLHGIHRFR